MVDKVIKKTTNKKLIIFIVVMLIIIVIIKILITSYQPSYKIKKSEVITCFVTQKEISKTIMTVGIIESLNKVIIESKESGIVINIKGVSGDNIKKGQEILKLSNENLEIEYLLLLEQLNKQKQLLKISQNEFETKDIDNSELILELNYNIDKLKSNVKKNTQLLKTGRISKNTLEEIENEYGFWIEKKSLTIQKWTRLTTLQVSTEEYLFLEIESINSKIENVQRRISRLIISAPYSGILNLENFDIGQNISSREKLGVIDRQDGFKLTTDIDEFYISNLNIGDIAHFNGNELKLNFISPVVVGKKVKLEFIFINDIPESIKSGQSFNIKIIQGIQEVKKVIESGSYIKESSGNWIYKVENNNAVKVPITLGIKNSEYNEVLTGLELGDEVIISSYKKYKDYEIINFEASSN